MKVLLLVSSVQNRAEIKANRTLLIYSKYLTLSLFVIRVSYI